VQWGQCCCTLLSAWFNRCSQSGSLPSSKAYKLGILLMALWAAARPLLTSSSRRLIPIVVGPVRRAARSKKLTLSTVRSGHLRRSVCHAYWSITWMSNIILDSFCLIGSIFCSISASTVRTVVLIPERCTYCVVPPIRIRVGTPVTSSRFLIHCIVLLTTDI
jgi:hypothetical protein